MTMSMRTLLSKTQIRFSGKQASVLALLVFVLPGVISTVGCGPSQEDMLMRAAQRKRANNDADEAEEKKDKSKPKAPKPSRAVAADEKKAEETKQPETSKVAKDQKPLEAIRPIEERKDTLSGEAKRQRSAQNIEKIAGAIMAYYKDRGNYPRAYYQTANKFKTLSWRVELLPYLGYEELYKKFDTDVPWNREPNKSLLKYIPDEYVSPERFDTNTNYQLPAHRKYMFGDNRGRSQKQLEDGHENTIMLVEVDDAIAVPWTSPQDYSPKRFSKFDGELGGLRKDGAFAVWANGWTVLLANELSAKQINDALTFEAGDGQRAGMIHRDIPVGKISDASVASVKKPSAPKPVKNDSSKPQSSLPIASSVMRAREPVPKNADVKAARAKLTKLFADKISNAKTDSAKSKLATDMLGVAAGMETDKPGVYSLQGAAMTLAVQCGDADTLIDAIDNRVGIFEVDAYEENITWLSKFARETISRKPDTIENSKLLQRSTRVIYAGIADNDYMRASAIARMCYRLVDEERTERVPRLVNRLRSLLGNANLEYKNSLQHLQAFRDDPEDAEAAAAFGRFLCFIKGDWGNGLPLLVKGGPEQLRELAQADLKGAGDTINRIALGDDWWSLSEMARTGVYRQAARDRAVYWYQMAYDSLPDSLDRMHVKSRLDEASDIDGTSPIALTLQLADELDVDLTVGLAAVAEVGQTRKRKRDDDDD